MPIYAYRCATCGHAQDVLQRLSDAVLTVCPACGASSYAKQVTAAGFQLKGSGWYVTDFRGGNAAKAEAEKADGAKAEAPKADARAADAGAPAAAPEQAPAKTAPAAAPAAAPSAPPPAPSSGT